MRILNSKSSDAAFPADPKRSFTGTASTFKPPIPEKSVQVSGLRFYSPELGRWCSRDPIEEDGGENLMVYAANTAIQSVDGLGLVSLSGVSPSAADQLSHTMRTGIDARGLIVINGQTGLGAIYNSLANLVKCSCSLLDNGLFRVRCKLQISFSCILSGDADASALNKIYGHEQRHVQNLLGFLRDRIAPAVSKLERDHEICCPHIEYWRVQRQSRDDFYRYLRAEATHEHEPFKSHEDGGMASFDPLPDTPNHLLPNPEEE